MIEAGAQNPAARTLNTPEAEIGEMMRMVIAHEVGHALGLPHNMKASSAYATDSLRSAEFTQKYGLTPSIMDYARVNYVAQPEDENVRYIRMMGPYDLYAINWGYRYIPEANSPIEENVSGCGTKLYHFLLFPLYVDLIQKDLLHFLLYLLHILLQNILRLPG